VYERFKKTEKEKKERKIKIEKAPGKRFGPAPDRAHGPLPAEPEPVPSPLSFLADWWDPPVISLLPLIPLPLAGNGRELLPSSIP
jgi:hypothetical protein